MKNYSKYLKPKSCVIFLFHGVIKKNPFKIRNYNNKHLTIDKFEKVLDDIKDKNGVCLSLDEVYLKIKGKNRFEDYSYAITFDDGFFNNYSCALPILVKKRLKATFYITTNFIEKNELSWIDKIEYMVERTNLIKKVNVLNKKFCIKNNKKSKINFLKKIRSLAKSNPAIDVFKLVFDIKSQLNYRGALTNINNILDKKMNWSQVKEINSHKNFCIGGHTTTHRILAFLNADSMKKEITNSIKIIYKNTGTKISHYSYPEGLPHTYSDREIKFLKKSGIKMCPSAEHGINNEKSNLYSLKRILVN
jgi:peptidoglycan/xylan/chitin deacetylase (PgdA/CDA1 family)